MCNLDERKKLIKNINIFFQTTRFDKDCLETLRQDFFKNRHKNTETVGLAMPLIPVILIEDYEVPLKVFNQYRKLFKKALDEVDRVKLNFMKFMKLKKYKEAVKLGSDLVALTEFVYGRQGKKKLTTATVHRNVGVAYMKLENYEKSKHHLNQALKIYPKYLGAKLKLKDCNLLSKNFN